MYKWLENTWNALAQASDTLPHALLLRGPAGIGKQALAEALAADLLCEQPQTDRHACGTCPACLWLASGNHPDFRCLQPDDGLAAGEEGEARAKAKDAKPSVWITVDQVRALHEFIHVASHRGGRKVIVVSPAESLNPAAANALLKNLEEPPSRTHFILISHRPHRLLRTILSRCVQRPLAKPRHDDALAWLSAQGVTEPEIALAQAGGAPLLAQTLAGSDVLAGRRACLRLLADGAFEPLPAAESLADTGIERFAGWLLRWTSDLVEQRMLGRICYNPDFSSDIKALASRIDTLAALRLQRRLLHEQRHVQHPLNARLYVESLLFAYQALINPVRRAA